ncbi:MAG: hypothetical protein U0744_04155 [Gemmataceae bacterium]
MSRRLLLLSTFFCVVAACGLVVQAILHTGKNVTPFTIDQIQVGMTEAEVENILGGPAACYYHVSLMRFDGCDVGINGEWYSETEMVSVFFAEGKAYMKRTGRRPTSGERPASVRGPMWRIARYFSSRLIE